MASCHSSSWTTPQRWLASWTAQPVPRQRAPAPLSPDMAPMARAASPSARTRFASCGAATFFGDFMTSRHNIRPTGRRAFHSAMALVLAMATATVLLAPTALLAQTEAWPARSVKVIVPYGAGGGTDILARMVTQKLAEKWGQPVVIENKPGADAMIGTEQAARSRPDGYTLVFIAPSHTLNPGMRSAMPYDTVKDFAPITMVASTPFALVVNNQVPAKNVRELLALARAQPGKLTFGSAESSSRLAGELFKTLGQVDILNVQYKSLPAEFADIAGGHIQMGFASLTSVLQFHKAGTMKVLGVSGNARSPLAPEIPTMAEEGLPGYDVAAWYGFCAPAGTPPAIINKVRADVAEVMQLPDVKAGLLKAGAVAVGNSPEEFRRFIDTEIVKSARIIKAAGIKAE
ncbi:MAG: tripartite tricarboxylate transporter substrate binding protein [Haliea sp.]|nr:MAG: tripartite tricarboxylate transporter substrate binding protein [Haliea sp.]